MLGTAAVNIPDQQVEPAGATPISGKHGRS